MIQYIKNIFCGMIVGLANIIPGVSGGTMAVILNIYDKLIESIGNLTKKLKENVIFLSAIGIGAVISILLFSKGINFLLEHYYMITNFFFIGVIIGSAPMIYRRATEDSFKWTHIIPCVLAFVIMLITEFMPNTGTEVVITTLSVGTCIQLILVGMISAICMIIPGISGSFVMLLFGMYETITTALSSFNVVILIPMAIGCLLGVGFGSKLISFVLKRYPQATYFAILGFVFGSIPVILGKIIEENAFQMGLAMILSVLMLIVGLIISYAFSSEKFKQYLIKKVQRRQKE